MTYLIVGATVFFGLHLFAALRPRSPGRDLRVRMGEGPYMGLFALVSLAGFALMLWGYGLARPAEVVFTPPVWGRHLNYVLMIPAFILLAAAYAPPGWIKRWTGHPMVLAVAIWAGGHVLANGDAASLILFGAFLGYALVSRAAAAMRGDRGGALARPRPLGDVLAVGAGCAAYAVTLIWLHPILSGVSVWPVVA